MLSDIENAMRELMVRVFYVFIRKGPETKSRTVSLTLASIIDFFSYSNHYIIAKYDTQSIPFQTYHQMMDQYCSAISHMNLPKETTTAARVSSIMVVGC